MDSRPAFMPDLETVVLNQIGKARRVTRNGREYLVAPLTLIVPGVLNGSRGPLYYPSEEIAANYDSWNDIPIIVYHPRKNGTFTSGRSPDVLDYSKIGRVYNARIDSDGKLKADGWFDLETVKRVDIRVFEALEQGKPIELSTGLSTVNYTAPGNFKGKPYDAVARNYRPDHLAILPDMKGACSINDGCGVLVNEEYQGTGTENSFSIDMDDLDDLLNGGEVDLVEWMQALNALPSSELKMTPEKACKIIKDGKVNDKPLTKAQRGMFGALCGKRPKKTANIDWSLLVANQLPDDIDRLVQDAINYKNSTSSSGGDSMKLSDQQRQAIVNDLTVNCECEAGKAWKGHDLTKLSDESLVAHHMVLKGGKAEFANPDGSKQLYNAATGKFEFQPATQPAPGAPQPSLLPPPPKRPDSMQEALELYGTPQDRAAWTAVLNSQNQQKAQLIEQIVNSSPDQSEQGRTNYFNYLKAKELPELQILANNLPRPQQPQRQESLIPSYFGAIGAPPTSNTFSNEPPLALPTYNFKKEPKAAATAGK